MTTWLQVHCGAYPLLLPAAAVIEVGVNEGHAGQAGRRSWRESSLRLVDLPGLLGCVGGARAIQVVVGEAGVAQAIVLVDAVDGVREESDDGFVEVGDVSAAFGAWFSGVLVDARGQGPCLLRMRHPFSWLDEDAGRTGARSSA